MKKLLTFLFAFLTVSGSARTISWRSGIGDDLLNRSGLSLDDSFTFELGAFGAGFTPSATNYGDWSSRWHAFGQATFEPLLGNGWEPGLQCFTKDTTVLGG